MIEVAFYAVALAVAAWAVRVRRATCRIPWERSTTYVIIQLALALVLISPTAGRSLAGFSGR